MQHYFVIAYDPTRDIWYSDTDTLEARFSDGAIWDDETQTWLKGDEVDDVLREQDGEIYGQLLRHMRAVNTAAHT